jgi:multidrug efflux pump subunit AcrA (membrane-fusion protein)
MHGKRYALTAVFLCALVLLGCDGDAAKAPAQAALKVVVAEVSTATVRDETTFNATLAAKETVEVRARISGYLQERLFEEGRLVKQ